MNQIRHTAKSTSNVDEIIGSKITMLRSALGMTRKDLAEKIGITHQQLHKYENGINRISASRLFEITRIINVNIVYFFEDFVTVKPEETSSILLACMDVMRDFMALKTDEQRNVIRRTLKTLLEA